jgi:hypothetical protein
MSTEPVGPTEEDPSSPAVDNIDESIASTARLSPHRVARTGPRVSVLAGGDATRAPATLTSSELRPIEGDSSGVSWDDPDEL